MNLKSTGNTSSWIGVILALACPVFILGMFLMSLPLLNQDQGALMIPAMFAGSALLISPVLGIAGAIAGAIGLYLIPTPAPRWHKVRSLTAIIVGLLVPAAIIIFLYFSK